MRKQFVKGIPASLILAALMLTLLPATPSQALVVPVHMIINTSSGAQTYDTSNLTDALNYLNNTVGYDNYLSATIYIAPLTINENFTGQYELHDIAIIGSGAGQTILYNESGTGGLFFAYSSNITISGLTIANMTLGVGFLETNHIVVSNLAIGNTTDEGIVVLGTDSVEVSNIYMYNVSGTTPEIPFTGIYISDANLAIIKDTYFLDTAEPIVAQDINVLEILNTTIRFQDSLRTDGIVMLGVHRALLRGIYLDGNYAENFGIYAESVWDLTIENLYAQVYWWGIGVFIPSSSPWGSPSLTIRDATLNYCPESIVVFNYDPRTTMNFKNITATAIGFEEEEGLYYGIYLQGYLNGTWMNHITVENAWWGIGGGEELLASSSWTPPQAPAASVPQPSLVTEYSIYGGGIMLVGYMDGLTLGSINVRNSTAGLWISGYVPPELEAGMQSIYLSSLKVEGNDPYDVYTAPVSIRWDWIYTSVSTRSNLVLVSGKTALIKVMEGSGIYWVGPYTGPFLAVGRDIGTANGYPPLPEGLIDTGIRLEAGAGEDSYVVIGIRYLQSTINSLNIDESTLTAYHYNDTSGEWEPLPTTVDTVNNIAYVTLNETGSPVVLLGSPLPVGVGGELLTKGFAPTIAMVLAATLILAVAIAAALRVRREEA